MEKPVTAPFIPLDRELYKPATTEPFNSEPLFIALLTAAVDPPLIAPSIPPLEKPVTAPFIPAFREFYKPLPKSLKSTIFFNL